jgi:hypothetical protein
VFDTGSGKRFSLIAATSAFQCAVRLRRAGTSALRRKIEPERGAKKTTAAPIKAPPLEMEGGIDVSSKEPPPRAPTVAEAWARLDDDAVARADRIAALRARSRHTGVPAAPEPAAEPVGPLVARKVADAVSGDFLPRIQQPRPAADVLDSVNYLFETGP